MDQIHLQPVPGVATDYVDGFGNYRQLTVETAEALRHAMHWTPEEAHAASQRVRVVAQGHSIGLGMSGTLTCEDGSSREIHDHLPHDLPLGYHTFRSESLSSDMRIIVTPHRCHELHERAWGWAIQLYAARSHDSWGIGDLADLRNLADWSRSLGAKLLQINPLGAASSGLPQATSPYYPSSRRFLNPLYLRIEELPGIERAADLCHSHGSEARSLNAQRLIDRDSIYRHKIQVLERLWDASQDTLMSFEEFRVGQGSALEEFGSYCVLAEAYGPNWRSWPEGFRHPAHMDVRQFADEHRYRVRFHQWLQYLLDLQLRRAAERIQLVFDLPVGVDPGGVDAWCWQDVLALDARVGAPPDQFNAAGQDWGLPPWIPHRLVTAQYEPYIQTIRANLRYAGGLRIDHVMGLFRLFWIPPGLSADKGAYVHYASEEMLGILALESQRAGAWIAGEDLGTVPSGMRGDLDRYGILSHRLVWFEDALPRDYPGHTVAAITTHDLPTVAGMWTGEDMAAEKRIGRTTSEDAFQQVRSRLQRVGELSSDAAVESAILGAYRGLGSAPSRVRLASLEDTLAVVERPNMPGTTTEWPNWSIALPQPLDVIQSSPLAARIAESLTSST